MQQPGNKLPVSTNNAINTSTVNAATASSVTAMAATPHPPYHHRLPLPPPSTHNMVPYQYHSHPHPHTHHIAAGYQHHQTAPNSMHHHHPLPYHLQTPQHQAPAPQQPQQHIAQSQVAVPSPQPPPPPPAPVQHVSSAIPTSNHAIASMGLSTPATHHFSPPTNPPSTRVQPPTTPSTTTNATAPGTGQPNATASSTASLLLHQYQQEARREGEREFDAGVGERQRQQDTMLQRDGGAALARKRRKTRSAYVSRYASKAYSKLLELHITREHQDATAARSALSEQSERHARVRQLIEKMEINLAKLGNGGAGAVVGGSAPQQPQTRAQVLPAQVTQHHKPRTGSVPLLPRDQSSSIPNYGIQAAQPSRSSHSLPLPPPPVSHALPLPQLPRTSSSGTNWNPIALLPTSGAVQGRSIMGGAGQSTRPPWNDVLDNAMGESGGKKTAASVSDVSGSEPEETRSSAKTNTARATTASIGNSVTTNGGNGGTTATSGSSNGVSRTRTRRLEAATTRVQ